MAPAWLAALFGVFILLAFTNGANLTDGVDGLAGSVTLVAFTLLGLVFSLQPAWDDARLFAARDGGGCAGISVVQLPSGQGVHGGYRFARIGRRGGFRGDCDGLPWILILAGGVYVIEDLSVMIQVFWFKRTGKRVFRMAPIHHHFEMGGWKENRIVIVFSAVGVVFGLLALLAAWTGIWRKSRRNG
jgi:phospho-N-acetylmuramoyl-pentapeptide-transferase